MWNAGIITGPCEAARRARAGERGAGSVERGAWSGERGTWSGERGSTGARERGSTGVRRSRSRVLQPGIRRLDQKGQLAGDMITGVAQRRGVGLIQIAELTGKIEPHRRFRGRRISIRSFGHKMPDRSPPPGLRDIGADRPRRMSHLVRQPVALVARETSRDLVQVSRQIECRSIHAQLSKVLDPIGTPESTLALHAPRPPLYAPRSTLHAPRSTLHAPRSTPPAPRSTLHAPRPLLSVEFPRALRLA